MTAITANVAAVLDGPAAAVAERPALVVDGGPVCSYGALAHEVERWAAGLASAGVRAGDRVALADWGGVRSTAVTLAAAHLGAATAQMNPLLTGGELTQLVEVSGCGPVGVAGDDSIGTLAGALGAGGTVHGTPPPVDAATDGGGLAPRAPGGDAAALVLFTSGTTGLPKAVPISHRAIGTRIQAYRGPFDADRRPTVTIMCVPSFHIGGMLGLLLNLYGGDTTVVQPRFDAGRWLAMVAEHRVVSAFLVPTMLRRILDHPALATTDTSSLRMISYGAAAAPTELVRRAMGQWPDAGFANTFGQTETLGAYTTLSPQDHRDPARIGSVGRPLAGVEVRLVDPATGAEVDPGGVGEIWVRSDQVVRATPPGVSDGAADAGAAADDPEWLHTGDLARQDGDGYLYPLGRTSDVINRGGEKFPPSEVADAIRAHPAVADVVVVGLPDPEMGQRVGAAVVVADGHDDPDLDQLRAWCRDRLAPFKLPEVVAVVDALPFNELGKLPRATAVELIASRSGGPVAPPTRPVR